MNEMSESLENKAFAFDPLLSPFSSLELISPGVIILKQTPPSEGTK